MYILVVDDEQLALNALINELKIIFPSAELHGEKRPKAAVEWAKELSDKGETLSYAFMDVKMPGMNGLELARHLKIIYPQVSLFFCTAYSEYALDAFGLFAKGYLMKPVRARDIERVLDEMVTDWRMEPTALLRDIRVKTFGHFEVFVDGIPLVFEREKSKELLAYLVDRHGSSVTTEQIASVLWEDEPYDRKLKNRTTATVTSLKNSLKAAKADDILIKTWNHLALDITKIKCDAYDYEKWDAVAVNSFHGEYMVNYSWAEFTTGKYVHMESEIGKI
ncbi:MAG: response regulator [Hominilimicola sp.]